MLGTWRCAIGEGTPDRPAACAHMPSPASSFAACAAQSEAGGAASPLSLRARGCREVISCLGRISRDIRTFALARLAPVGIRTESCNAVPYEKSGQTIGFALKAAERFSGSTGPAGIAGRQNSQECRRLETAVRKPLPFKWAIFGGSQAASLCFVFFFFFFLFCFFFFFFFFFLFFFFFFFFFFVFSFFFFFFLCFCFYGAPSDEQLRARRFE